MITQEMLDDDQAFWCQLFRMNMVPEHLFGQKEDDRIGVDSLNIRPLESYKMVILDFTEDEKT